MLLYRRPMGQGALAQLKIMIFVFRNGNENYHLGQNFLYINLISSYENLVSILVCVVPLCFLNPITRAFSFVDTILLGNNPSCL